MCARWRGVSTPVRISAWALVAVLAYGTVVHLVLLAIEGWGIYPGLPGWLRVYFVSLTLLDPLAATLLALRRRSGVLLTVAVLLTDAVANGLAHYAFDPGTGVTAGRVGHVVISLLAIWSLAAAPALWRAAGDPTGTGDSAGAG